MSKLVLFLDAGHGLNTQGKRVPDGSMREFQFNSATAEKVASILGGYENTEIHFVYDRDGSDDTPLAARTNNANVIYNARKAEKDTKFAYVSIHANAYGSAFNGSNGIETFVYKSTLTEAVALANAVQTELISATGLANRGVKVADYHVLRETDMTAILCECGFMTNPTEAGLLKSDAYREKCANAIVNGIAKRYELTKKDTPKPLTYKAHVQSKGWLPEVANDEIAGTVGKSLRMEALVVNLDGVNVQAHVQGIGWQNPVTSGQIAGTVGKSLRMEAVKIWLTGEIAKTYDIFYCVHVQNYGWLPWVKNYTDYAGTVGKSLQIEAIQIKLVRK